MAATSLPFLLFLFTFFKFSASQTADQTLKTFLFRVDSHFKPSIFPTHYHWYTSEFADPPQILHVNDTVFHGFSTSLTPDQVASMSSHPSVLAVIEDQRRHLHTTRSPQFLGLSNQRGLWSESDYGSDVIVGVFDTGVWPERLSFRSETVEWKGENGSGEAERKKRKKR